MYGSELFGFSLWWIVPIIMIIICFVMMRGRRGSMMCGFGSRVVDGQQTEVADSAKDILDKRYASGEINKDEYEEKKRTLTDSTDSIKK
jgi:putative membrane protein